MRCVVSLLKGPILITGGSGQLGHALANAARERGLDHVAVSRPDFDFDAEDTIESCFSSAQPRLVINAAAYTAVDAAETNAQAADRANHTGPWRLAKLCAGAGIPLIHISTDYVFDGTKIGAYVETDPTHPAGVYGASKRAGELAVLATGAKAIILRTAWVYSAHGKNFARTMLGAARKTNSVRVVMDQHGTPTSAPDLAAAILDIAALLDGGWKPGYGGIFHATNAGETTWHGFAAAIFAAAEPAGLKPPTLTAIRSEEWPTPAKRPANSRLDCGKLASTFGVKLPAWQLSVAPIVEQLVAVDGAR
jgi:dTDP-4-dehydrorhamnose reductase